MNTEIKSIRRIWQQKALTALGAYKIVKRRYGQKKTKNTAQAI